MKQTLVFVLVFSLLFACAGCGSSGEKQGSPAAAPAAVPTDLTPAATETVQDEIAAASIHELKGIIAQYQSAGDYEIVYEAALRLLELDPAATGAYIAAAEALAILSAANYEEINRLMAQGAENAEDVQALVDWAGQNQPALSIEVPFVSDYASEDAVNTDGITTGNQTNAAKYNGDWHGGLLTWQGDWVYLSRPDEDFAVYRMRADGSGYQRLGDARGSSLNAVGDWLYYINLDDGYKPYRIRTDGNLREKLSEDGCAFLSVSGDWLFYDNGSDDGRLYQVKIDGSEKIRLSDMTAMFSCVASGWVYYCEKSENASLYRVPVGGGARQLVVDAGMRTYSVKDENGAETGVDLTTDAIQTYCVAGDWVYFFDLHHPNSVRRVHTDGTGYELFWPFDMSIATLNVADGILACSFFDQQHYEEDGFFIGEEIVTLDIETLEKQNHVMADTEPVCTGPEGWVYFLKYGEGLAWYAMDRNGAVYKIG